MKHKHFVVLIALSIMLAAVSSFAAGRKIESNIPFDFIVGKTTLPAGKYTVSAISEGQTALLIRSEDTKSAVVVLTRGVQAKSGKVTPQLDFTRYGQKYFLSRIWSGDKDGRELPKTALEREMAQGAQNGSNTTLAARLR